ncbi:alpha/beta hydrolase [Pigmentiphaga aceris]|uniref:Alpha/beta hydrolase n=1 Tax=Pigmentiphaga aceris TaxID=1940612 RepID=A0A5C0AVQ3_9BURK|nr:alpha/beta hydrolase [Pigmentiphaga aceris]QEI06285.1 alpha/beta hydrolase [Pigmentiphaga aceris]
MIDSLIGPAGHIQLLIEQPAGTPVGIAMISHPQPLLGGNPRHIVPHSIAKRLVAEGWIAVRPSFRGVGESAGSYDEGIGETEDAVLIAEHLRVQYPDLPLALVGFSFGAHVYARVACALEANAPADAIVLMGMPVGLTPGGREYEAFPIPARSLLLHGQDDAMAPLSQVLDWARASHHPVVVVPGVDHFFKGVLPSVVDHVVRHLRAVSAQ